jgi:alpha-beta hydrolase superfamily lysophospholipase
MGNIVPSTPKQKPIIIFVHGLFDNHTQAKPFQEIVRNLGYDQIITFDFADAWYPPFVQSLKKPFKSSLGQNSEIEKLNSVYQEVVQSFENCTIPVPPIILIGISRGASLILTFLATKRPQHVIGAICESPFDTLEHVLEIRVPKYKHLALLLFKNYDTNGIKPADSINNIDPDINILFVASKEDTSVPYQLTTFLYQLFMKTGNRPHSELLLFPSGKHAKLLKTHEEKYSEKITSFLTSLVGI